VVDVDVVDVVLDVVVAELPVVDVVVVGAAEVVVRVVVVGVAVVVVVVGAVATGVVEVAAGAAGVEGTVAGAVTVSGVPLAAATVEARIFVTTADPGGRPRGVETSSEAGPTASAADAPAVRCLAALRAEPVPTSTALAAGG